MSALSVLPTVIDVTDVTIVTSVAIVNALLLTRPTRSPRLRLALARTTGALALLLIAVVGFASTDAASVSEFTLAGHCPAEHGGDRRGRGGR